MKDNRAFLRHILDEIDFLTAETEKIDFEEFKRNKVLTRASARSFQVIGEAVKNLSPDFTGQYPDIDWKNMAGMRDRIVHYYFGVNWRVVWDVVKNALPDLKRKLEAILSENSG